MAAIDYEAEYNNRARVPEHPAIFIRWARAAEAFRASHPDAELGVAYGRSSREKIDIFWPAAGREAPIALFIHGGYWRSLDPSAFSHLAGGPNAHGIALALVGYDLCPGVTDGNDHRSGPRRDTSYVSPSRTAAGRYQVIRQAVT